MGLDATAATVLYRRRRCSVARTISHENNYYHCTAAGSMGYHCRGRLFAAAATVLYRRRRCSVARTVSHDNNDYHCTAMGNTEYLSRGRLFAAAETVLYHRRRCSVARTVSHDNNDYHCTAAGNTGYHSRGHRCDRYMTKLFAAAATVLYRRHCCSVARTVSHDSNDYHCTAAENTGYHSRGRRCDRCMTEAT